MRIPQHGWSRVVPLVVFLVGVAGSVFSPWAHASPPVLTREERARIREAARDRALTPVQREGLRRRAFELEARAAELSVAAEEGAAGTDGTWQLVPAPSSRATHTAIYDPPRDRMIVFAGANWFGSSNFNDVWTMSLSGTPTWTSLAPAGTPPGAGTDHAAFYDPVRDRMVVFAGGTREVWALSLSVTPTWTKLAPAGTPPSARSGCSAFYDPVRDRMVVFGGYWQGSLRGDVWALSLAGSPTWTQLAPSGTPPVARAWHTAIYDPPRDRMLVFGGSAGGDYRNDVWALALSGTPAWSELLPAGALPDGRSNHTAMYDPVRDRMVVSAGDKGSSSPEDAWALSLAGSPTWTEIAPGGAQPIGRSRHTAIYDPPRDRMVTFGGENWDAISLGDTWALTLAGTSTWSDLAPTGTPPTEVWSHTAILDPVRNRMVVFGGIGDAGVAGNPRNEVRALSLAGTPVWFEVPTEGTPPSGCSEHTAIYDPPRDRMVVFGGSYTSSDVWALTLGGTPTWSQLAAAGTPPSARRHHTAIYDPSGDRMVVFGGNGLNDVWALTLGGTPTWAQLAPSGTPPSGRSDHSAIYDSAHGRMVVFGGNGMNDVWALTLNGTPTWSQLAPAGTPPSGRSDHTAIYDPTRDRMVVFGGNWQLNDVWALSLGGTPTWTQLAPAGGPPRGRCGHTAIYDQARDRIVAFAGYDCDEVYFNDVWTLTWDPPQVAGTRPTGVPDQLALYSPQPHPFKSGGRIIFSLPRETAIKLQIFDLGGRVVETLVDGEMPAGRHEIPWAVGAAPSGVYYLELRAGAFSKSRPLVLTR